MPCRRASGATAINLMKPTPRPPWSWNDALTPLPAGAANTRHDRPNTRRAARRPTALVGECRLDERREFVSPFASPLVHYGRLAMRRLRLAILVVLFAAACARRVDTGAERRRQPRLRRQGDHRRRRQRHPSRPSPHAHVGEAVTVTNRGTKDHGLTSDTIDTGTLRPGESTTVFFTQTGNDRRARPRGSVARGAHRRRRRGSRRRSTAQYSVCALTFSEIALYSALCVSGMSVINLPMLPVTFRRPCMNAALASSSPLLVLAKSS